MCNTFLGDRLLSKCVCVGLELKYVMMCSFMWIERRKRHKDTNINQKLRTFEYVG